MLVHRKSPELEPAKRWLNIRDAAAYASAKICAIRKLIAERKIKAQKLGRGFVIDRFEIDRYLERHAA